jgi:TolA-binding protein
LNYLPPADFLDLLDIGEAETRLRWGEHDRAIALLAAVTDRDPAAPFAPEAIYRRGIAAYLKTRSSAEMEGIWAEIRERFPDSIWARRIP